MIPTEMVIGVVWSKDTVNNMEQSVLWWQWQLQCMPQRHGSWSDKCEPLDSDFLRKPIL